MSFVLILSAWGSFYVYEIKEQAKKRQELLELAQKEKDAAKKAEQRAINESKKFRKARDEAFKIEKKATIAQKEAEKRLVESLVFQGKLEETRFQWFNAKKCYLEAFELAQKTKTQEFSSYLGLWRTYHRSPTMLYIFHAHPPREGRSISFSLDGKLLASASSNQIKIWEVKSWRLLKVFAKSSKNSILKIKFSPKKDVLASYHKNGSIVLWKALTGKKIFSLKGHKGSINAIAFSQNGNHLFSAGKDLTIRFWNMETRKQVHVFKAYSRTIYTIDVSTNNKWLLSGGRDETVRLWNIKDRVLGWQ